MFKELKNDVIIFLNGLKEIKINKIKLLIIFLLMIITNVLGLITPLLFGNTINGIIEKSIDKISINIILMCTAFLGSIVIDYLYNFMLINETTNMEIEMKRSVFSSILSFDYKKYNSYNKGTFINNIEQDATVISTLLSNNINLVLDIISMILSLFLMFYISPMLSILSFLSVPITVVIYTISGKRIKEQDIDYKERHDSFISFLNESIYGWKFLNLFNVKDKRSKSFKDIIKILYSIQIKKFKIEYMAGTLLNIIAFVINILSIIIAAYFIFNNMLTLGMFTAFNSYSDRFKSSSIALSQLNSTIQEMSVSLSRLNNVVKYTNENYSTSKTKLNQSIDNISIESLSYSINEKNNVFKDITLKFEKNNIYIIKGESGCGKSTLLNMICNFIDDYDGYILINNVSSRKIDFESLRERICYITQDEFIFTLSVKDNIRLYRDIDLEKIEEICKLLKIHDSISNLPNKYNTVINENGCDLSGGEKQRLCIARSMVSNPDVYLFDEVTSAIDEKNTEDIVKLIEDISKDKIVIITSHNNLNFSLPVKEFHLINSKLYKRENLLQSI